LLMRTIVCAEMALRRMAKALRLHALRGKAVFVDGYNVLITTESLLEGRPVYLCDDGFLRDTRGFFMSHKVSQIELRAISEVFNLLAQAGPSRVEVLLDQQISRSGELAKEIRCLMAKLGLPGEAKTARDVDHKLKVCGFIVASSDGNVIDAAHSVIDLPREIAIELGISPLSPE
jgi:hypothetical protein